MKRFLIFAFAFSIGTSIALADEKTAPGLPGVKPRAPIVSAPPPAPEPDRTPQGSLKNFRIGNTDVSVSGELILDVRTSGSRSSRR